MSLFLLYVLFVVLPGIHGLIFPLGIMSIVAVVGAFISGLAYLDRDCEKQTFLSFRGIAIWLCIVTAVLGVFVPTETAVYKIAGAYAVTNTEGIKELPDNIVGAANSYLKELSANITKGDSKDAK